LVLKNAGYDFEIITADIDEKEIRYENPKQLVLALAHAKADAILKKLNISGVLITADQVVVCNGKIFEKPRDEKEAREFIRCYLKHPMETISSVVVTNIITKKRAEGVDISKVYFKNFPEQAIDAALENGKIMHCAGAMRCEEEPFNNYIDRFEGTKDSTSGLPLKLLKRLLKEV
jgi:septum formation protein